MSLVGFWYKIGASLVRSRRDIDAKRAKRHGTRREAAARLAARCRRFGRKAPSL